MHNHNLDHKGIKKIMNLKEKAFGLTRTRQNQSPQTTTIPYKLQGAFSNYEPCFRVASL